MDTMTAYGTPRPIPSPAWFAEQLRIAVERAAAAPTPHTTECSHCQAPIASDEPRWCAGCVIEGNVASLVEGSKRPLSFVERAATAPAPHAELPERIEDLLTWCDHAEVMPVLLECAAALRSHPTPVPCANCGGATVSICRACVTPSELAAFESGLDHPSPVPQGEERLVEARTELEITKAVAKVVLRICDRACWDPFESEAMWLQDELAALTTPQTEGAK